MTVQRNCLIPPFPSRSIIASPELGKQYLMVINDVFSKQLRLCLNAFGLEGWLQFLFITLTKVAQCSPCFILSHKFYLGNYSSSPARRFHILNNSNVKNVPPFVRFWVTAALVWCGLLSLCLSIALSDTVYSSQGILGSLTTFWRDGRLKDSWI